MFLRRTLFAGLLMSTWMFPIKAVAMIDVDGVLGLYARFANPFAGYMIPTREVLRQNSPFWHYFVRDRRLRGPRPGDCGLELLNLRRGFKAIYPDGPNASKYSLEWRVHVVMEHFPALLICGLRYRLQHALDEIDTRGLKVEPFPQRINAITFDFAKHGRVPQQVEHLRGAISDLIWMSYKGYAPAMLELAKLSGRDDVIRLTPRFTYYLLAVSDRAGLTDPALPRLLAIARKHLNAEDRAEIEQRIARRRWPKTERMVLD